MLTRTFHLILRRLNQDECKKMYLTRFGKIGRMPRNCYNLFLVNIYLYFFMVSKAYVNIS